MNCLSPSILSADYSILGEQLKQLDEAGAQYVHIDVMDEMCIRDRSWAQASHLTITTICCAL